MESWVDFTLPSKINFEPDGLKKIASRIKSYASRFLLVTMREEEVDRDLLSQFINSLHQESIGVILYDDLVGIPDTEQIDSATYFSKKTHIDGVIAFGSLEAFHAAKAIALLVNNAVFAENLFVYEPNLKNPALPIFAVPFEPSMGEELLPAFALLDKNSNERLYFKNNSLSPKAVFYDPKVSQNINELQVGRLVSAMVSYAAEMALSPYNNSITSNLLFDVIKSVQQAGTKFYADPQNQKHLEAAFWNSAKLGMAMSQVGMGTTWAITHAVVAEVYTNFYYVFSVLLPHVLEYFLTSSPTRFLSIAKNMGEETKDISVIEASIKAIEAIRKINLELKIPKYLTDLNITDEKFSVIAQNAVRLPQINNAPKKVSAYEVESILLSAL